MLPKKPNTSGLFKWQVKSKKYYEKNKYIMLPKFYWKWYCQQKGNSWKKFDAWIMKNYLLNVIRPVKEMKAIKMTLIDIKGNFEK